MPVEIQPWAKALADRMHRERGMRASEVYASAVALSRLLGEHDVVRVVERVCEMAEGGRCSFRQAMANLADVAAEEKERR